MRRFISLFLLVLLATLVAAAPAGANAKLLPTEVAISGAGFTEIATSPAMWRRAVGEGFGELALGALFDDEVTIVMSQSYAGWNGKHPADLFGKTMLGDITFIAENGDVLFGTYRGEIDWVNDAHDPELPAIWANSELTFRRGTGQFRGVTGTVEIDVARCFSAGLMGFWIADDAVVYIR
jgi:hypothetical protein